MKKNRSLKSDMRLFLTSEEGKMLDADIVKMGIALGILGGAAADSEAGWTNHRSRFSEVGHASSTSTVHTSHSSGGWC